MDILKKMIDQYHGTPFCEWPPERQAEYLGAIAQRGASDALRALGLHDAEAAADIADIRDLLRAMRVMKKAAWTTALHAVGRIVGWCAVLALAALFMNRHNAKEIAAIVNP